jgi:hypothetical protein
MQRARECVLCVQSGKLVTNDGSRYAALMHHTPMHHTLAIYSLYAHYTLIVDLPYTHYTLAIHSL